MIPKLLGQILGHSMLDSQDSTPFGPDTDVPNENLGKTPCGTKSKYESLADRRIHPGRDMPLDRY